MTLDTTHIKEEMELQITKEEDGVLCKAIEILEDIRDGLIMESSRRTPMLEIEFFDATEINWYKLRQLANGIVDLLTNDSDCC